MARIRSIKPEFWTSAQVLECSPNARLLFIGLWTFADDTGRHPDSEKQVKAEVFPSDDFSPADIRGMLEELSENGLIQRYEVEGKGYFLITGWRHQRIDKPQPAKHPPPPDTHSGSNRRPLDECSRLIGNEGIGNEGISQPRRKLSTDVDTTTKGGTA